MSVLTAPSNSAFSRQLPLAPLHQPATKDMRGSGSAGPQHEPAAQAPLRLVGDKLGGPFHGR
jgi:hypothetical protein